MTYVALDGCKTAVKLDLLDAFLGIDRTFPRTKYRERGWTVRFGWGWGTEKRVSYLAQGELVHAHFEFVGDYYWFLTDRDVPGSYMNNTFQEAIDFAKAPLGQSPFNNRDMNPEGNGIKYVGCPDCFFDE